MRSLMQSKSRLPNISSFIGRLGNMELMHLDCQGSTGVVSNCSGPSSFPFNRPRQNRSGNSPYGPSGPADSITRGSLDRGVNVPPCVSNH